MVTKIKAKFKQLKKLFIKVNFKFIKRSSYILKGLYSLVCYVSGQAIGIYQANFVQEQKEDKHTKK